MMTWDDGQQLIRKLSDALAGILVTYGIFDANGLVLASGAIAGVFSFGWWYWWNRTRPAAPASNVAKAAAKPL